MTSSSGRSSLKRLLASKRTRGIVITAASVLALAGVIFAFAALSAPKDAIPDGAGVAAQSVDDYQRALAAEQSGDTTAAVALLKKVVAKDPDNSTAKKKLVELQRGQETTVTESNRSNDPTSTSRDETKTTPPDNTAYLKAIADLSTLLPARIDGFKLGHVEKEKTDALVTAEPAPGGPMGAVAFAELTVHDQQTASAADGFAERVTHKLFPKGYGAVAVGDFQGHFGTAGTHVAAISFPRGRYVFEVIVTVNTGDPAKYKDLVIAVAKTFPASHR